MTAATDRAVFDFYVTKVLPPALKLGTVVILDSLVTNEIDKGAKILKGNDCWFLFQPRYTKA